MTIEQMNEYGRVSKIDSVLNLLGKVAPSIDLMERLVGIVKRFQMMVYEPESLFKYRKEWIAFLIAFGLYSDYKASKLIKADEVKSRLENIRRYDNKFAEDVNKILPFIGGNNEVSYLIMYRNDADNWRNYDDTYSIDFFIERIKLFLEGGFGRGRFGNNMKFIGLHKDFGDKTLKNTILENKAIRNLLYYNEQVKYLGKLIDLCKKSEKSGVWEGFWGEDGFWDKAGKGKGKHFDRYAKAFEAKYGNKHFAEVLLSEKKVVEERPEGWGGIWVGNRLVKDGILTLLLKEIQYHPYQRQKIIIPASLALSRILREREEKLKAKVISKFSSLLKWKKRILLKELNKDMAELIRKSIAPLSDYDAISKEQEEILGKMTASYIAYKTSKLVEARNLQLAFVDGQLATGELLKKGDIRGSVYTGIAYTLAGALQSKKLGYENFEHISEEDFKYLQKLIPRVRDVIRSLTTVYNYIKSKMEQEYTIRINALEMPGLDSGKRKNINFKYDDISRILNRLV